VISLSFFFTIYNAFVFVDSNGSNSVTIRDWTHAHAKCFLTMTDTITSKNIGLFL